MPAGLALRAGAATAAVAIAVSLSACGGSSKAGRGGRHETVLTVDVSVGTIEAVRAWATAAEKRSDGTLRIDVKVDPVVHGRTPDIEPGVLQRVRSGEVPLAAVGARAFDLRGVRSFQPLLAPFLVDSYDLERRVLASSLAPRMLAGTKRIGLVGLAILPGPRRRMLGMARPFREPRDFRGSVVGMQPGGVAAATIRALGARPRAEPQGIHPTDVDAYEQQLFATSSGQLYRDAHYMTTDLAPWPRPLVVVVNEEAYRRLTQRQRNALADARRASLDAAMQTVRNDDRDGRATLCSASVAEHFGLVTSSSAQRAAMRRAVAPVYVQLEHDRSVAALIRGIEAMKPRARPDPAVRCPRATGADSTRTRTPIDGVYVMDTSRTDVPAAESAADADSAFAENLGHYVYVFDRGRFAFQQRYEDACTWGDGRFTVTGHSMRWIFTDGGGIAPNGANDGPGEEFRFTWSRFRDTITLGPVRGAISPRYFRRRVWHRVSATPSLSVFDKLCAPPAHWDAP
jgi:TRAP-type C4-dicarboxylate transport system substrate-binding protein